MEYKKFRELVNKGECKTIDYKILCNAFIKGNEKDTAELLKDIIALSNNGNTVSYLIIGVSDDRNGFKSVENRNLTDDRVQNLCRDYIFPNPKVKLLKCCWADCEDERHKNIDFIIIKVGPQARQCFRFNKDFINYDKRYCFRKNEVWIRREATSDLALPEEIKRLLEGKDPMESLALENNIDYRRLSMTEFRGVVKKDVYEFLKSINSDIEKQEAQFGNKYKNTTWDILKINIDGNIYKAVLLIVDKCTGKGELLDICSEIPVFHHGVLIISIGNITASSMEHNHIRLKERWGYFCINNETMVGKIINNLPTNKDDFSLEMNETFCLALDKVYNTDVLYNKLYNVIDTLSQKEDIKSYLEGIYKNINNSLYSWKAEGLPYKTRRVVSKYLLKKIQLGQPISLKEHEFIDIDKYGDVVMRRIVEMDDEINNFLK